MFVIVITEKLITKIVCIPIVSIVMPCVRIQSPGYKILCKEQHIFYRLCIRAANSSRFFYAVVPIPFTTVLFVLVQKTVVFSLFWRPRCFDPIFIHYIHIQKYQKNRRQTFPPITGVHFWQQRPWLMECH